MAVITPGKQHWNRNKEPACGKRQQGSPPILVDDAADVTCNSCLKQVVRETGEDPHQYIRDAEAARYAKYGAQNRI